MKSSIFQLVVWTGIIASSEGWFSNRFSRRCYEELGCFSNFGWWIFRPLDTLPESPDKIATRFLLNTRAHPDPAAPGVLLYRSLRSSTSNILNSFVNISAPFNPLLPTKILIHGFLDMPLSPAWQKMTSAILAHDDVNVVRVDWSSGNGFPYTQATSNTRVVGGQVALFILRLKNQLGMSPGQFHILGHSLGAHTAGYAGQRVEGLGRITGLDPAEPYFQYFHSSIRLDPSDADFVDVIHTDGGSILNLVVGGSGFGMSQACGHVDFFPNGGADQPGCFEADRKVNARHWKVAEDIACSHNRAVLYFIESLSSTDCEFVAHQCADYEAFEEGKCSSCTDEEVCGVMGIKAEELKGKEGLKMFLKTRGDPPFCLK